MAWIGSWKSLTSGNFTDSDLFLLIRVAAG